MTKKLTFLGSGSSLGVPNIGCHCSVCTSLSSYDKRLRSSCLIDWEGKKFLIDPGPDFRQQMLLHKVTHLDAVLITHAHFDHIAGFDDLRVFPLRTQKPMPCILLEESYQSLRRMYSYLIDLPVGAIPCFVFERLKEDYGHFNLQGLPIRYVTYRQKGVKVAGFILGQLAYITDIREFKEEIFGLLQGIDTLIISAARRKKDTLSSLHLTIEEAIVFARRVGAKNTLFTHLSHDIHYETLLKELPEGFLLSYDGLTVPL